MERGYGGEARFERSLGVTGAGAAEMAWEKATEGQGRRVGLEMQKQHGRMLRRGSEVGGYGDFFLLQSRTSFFFGSELLGSSPGRSALQSAECTGNCMYKSDAN